MGISVLAVCVSITALQNVVVGWRNPLSTDDFVAWRDDHGTWTAVGEASMSPQDEKRIATQPGKGVLVNGPDGKTVNLFSKVESGDVLAHIEFMVPKGSNSGVYFQGRYEVQILDSWGVPSPTYTDCGGIYQRWDEARDPKGYEGHAPRMNASLAPGEWQTYDVIFRAPRFDSNGKKTENARFIRVLHNGRVVHENVEVTGPTRAAAFEDEKPTGPLMFQGDHGPVAYRNIWLAPVEDAAKLAALKQMPNEFFAMDTGTKDADHQTPKAQVDLVKELGYAGIGPHLIDELPEMISALKEAGLKMFAAYTVAKANADGFGYDSPVKAGIEAMKGTDGMVWLAIASDSFTPSAEEGDAKAIELIREIADLANASGVRVALYPHKGFLIERVEDAVRLAKEADRPNVGVTFNLCHWLSVAKDQDVRAAIEKALPKLYVVTINGADKDGRGWDELIQTLDRGTYDVGGFLHMLKDVGYAGPIGLQAYGIPGSASQNLSKSMLAWQAMVCGPRDVRAK